MLSIVPLLAGGGLYETGAGGSAPKHVQQFLTEGHLRWDSLGEYLATAVAFTQLGENTKDENAKMLGECLNKAIGRLLDNRKSPSRRGGEIDNRATTYYVALYWSEYLAQQNPDYKPIYEKLTAARSEIVQNFKESQDKGMDIGGYYLFDPAKANEAMRPSSAFNKIIDEI